MSTCAMVPTLLTYSEVAGDLERRNREKFYPDGGMRCTACGQRAEATFVTLRKLDQKSPHMVVGEEVLRVFSCADHVPEPPAVVNCWA